MYSEHANAMALAMNIANKEQADIIARKLLEADKHNYIKRESGMTMVTPAMSYFLHKGLCGNGYIDESLEMFRNRFDKMLQPQYNGTLWEEWWLDAIGRSGKLQKGRTRSDAQTESAFPPALFAEFLLGLEVTEPGMREIEIKRPATEIKNIESLIPTPRGNVKVEWKIDDEKGNLILNIPDETKVKVPRSSLEYLGNTIRLNGRVVKTESPDSFIIVEKGNHQISF
jgi:hypothetical protein